MSGWYPGGGGPNRSEAEDLEELHRHGHLELLVRARRRLAVGAPALEACGVAEPIALHVLVGDLGDETGVGMGAQRLPAQVLARVPPALRARSALARLLCRCFGFGPASPRVVAEGAVAMRLEVGEELGARGGGEAAGDTHVVQHAVVVVEAEQQRSDP